ncbi:MAG: prepilin-type N-terminal cleavage/methylation domain-containing protein [Synergistota bacterium]|nr:prepilin-type N-terminal cleavage/methylation domain-containing protein [Synergistota bacterium]
MNVNTRLKKMRKSRGFTLVELLIVIIIIGILAGGMLLVAGGGTDKANATKIVSDLRTLKTAALMYYADTDSWPAQGEIKKELIGYIDRDLTGDGYEWYDASTGSFDLTVGYDGDLMNEDGVREKLAGMAEKSGLYGDATADTVFAVDDDIVYMVVK